MFLSVLSATDNVVNVVDDVKDDFNRFFCVIRIDKVKEYRCLISTSCICQQRVLLILLSSIPICLPPFIRSLWKIHFWPVTTMSQKSLRLGGVPMFRAQSKTDRQRARESWWPKKRVTNVTDSDFIVVFLEHWADDCLASPRLRCAAEYVLIRTHFTHYSYMHSRLVVADALVQVNFICSLCICFIWGHLTLFLQRTISTHPFPTVECFCYNRHQTDRFRLH